MNFRLIVLVLVLNLKGVFALDFPLRKVYSELSFISTEDLNNQYDKSFIIDARSNFEYNVVHITKAVNIPVAKKSFISTLKRLILTKKPEQMVFYCNGITCKKSYKAAKKVQEKGYKNVYVYDAGIFNWIQAHPEKAVLLGTSPVDSSKIINKTDLTSRMLDKDNFSSSVQNGKTLLIDVRDPFQIKSTPDFGKKVRRIPLRKFGKLIKKGKLPKKKTLYIFDAVGKQVRWLQYYLEKYDYKNYYFLKGGTKAAQ